MSRTAYKLNAAKVKTIKKALWLGVPQGVIASKFDVSQAMISRISHGDAYSQEPWPDGTTGQLRYSTLVIDGIDFHSIPPGVGYHADAEIFTEETPESSESTTQYLESKVLDIDNPGEVDTKEVTSSKVDLSNFEWEPHYKELSQFKTKGKIHPLLEEARVSKDKNLKAATGIILSQIDPSEWSRPYVKKNIHKLLKESK